MAQVNPFARLFMSRRHNLVGFDQRHHVGRRAKFVRAHLHQVAHFQILLFGVDTVGVDLRAFEQVGFQPGICVDNKIARRLLGDSGAFGHAKCVPANAN